MKRLAILFQLLILPLYLEAQFSIDSAGFRAYRVDVYYGINSENVFISDRRDSFNTDALFCIKNKVISAEGLRDQLKCFYIKEIPKYTPNFLAGYGGYGLDCLDHGLFKCFVNILYVPKTDTYVIRIDYSNMRFLFECKITDERPIDNIIDYTLDNQRYRNDPDYTDQEIRDFFTKLPGALKGIFSGTPTF
jgi:hypothetical protein